MHGRNGVRGEGDAVGLGLESRGHLLVCFAGFDALLMDNCFSSSCPDLTI